MQKRKEKTFFRKFIPKKTLFNLDADIIMGLERSHSGRVRMFGRLSRRPAVLGGRIYNKTCFFYIYVLKSLKDNNLYIGKTKNLKNRLKRHQGGYVKATKNRLPLRLVYYEAYRNKNKCAKQELFYKFGIGRETLKHKI
jgi:putative endonuclease